MTADPTPTSHYVSSANLAASFDENEHCIGAGWATHHGHGEIRCRWWQRRHVLPNYAPQPPNGYAPSNSARCPRCRAWLRWFRIGQHRRGSYDKDVFDAYRGRA